MAPVADGAVHWLCSALLHLRATPNNKAALKVGNCVRQIYACMPKVVHCNQMTHGYVVPVDSAPVTLQYRVYVAYVHASAERRPFTSGPQRTYLLLLAHAFGPLGLSVLVDSLGRP